MQQTNVFDLIQLSNLSGNDLPMAGQTLTFADGDFAFNIGEPITFTHDDSGDPGLIQQGDTTTVGTVDYVVFGTVSKVELMVTVSDGTGGTILEEVSASIITLQEVGSPGNFITYLLPDDGIDLIDISQIEIVAIDLANDRGIDVTSVDDNDNVTIENFAVDGTTGDDLIDINYLGDPEGDQIDNLDGVNGSDDDLVLAGAGNDIVESGLGNDTIFGGTGNDSLSGGVGNDSLFGGDGDDILVGNAGDDTLFDVDVGVDTLFGGSGSDTFIVNDDFGGALNNANEYRGAEFDDEPPDAGDFLNASGMTQNVTLNFTGAGRGTLVSGTGFANFRGMEHVTLGQGDDTVTGALGNDTVISGAGDDTLFGGAGNDNLTGGLGNDSLLGGVGDDRLVGNAGDDTLGDFEAGADTLLGGGGNDTFLINDDFGFNNIYRGAGPDDGADSDTLDATLMLDDVTLILTDPEDGTLTSATGSAVISGMENINLGSGDDTVTGSSGDDAVFGGLGNDSFSGGLGNDSFTGGAGNDTFADDAGSDTLLGGDGDDSFIVSDGFGSANVYNGGEFGASETAGDTLDATGMTVDVTLDLTQRGATNPEGGTLTSAGGADDAQFIGIENINLGSGDDTVIGSSGNDTVNTGLGSDTVEGGAGNDTFNLGFEDEDMDVVIFSDGDGNDRLINFEIPLTDNMGGFIGVDMLDVSGLTTDGITPVNVNDVMVRAVGAHVELTFPNGQTITLENTDITDVQDTAQLVAMGIPCFVKGTGIKTPAGKIKVEDLQVGQLVETLDHGLQPIRWIGRRKVTAVGEEYAPIVFEQGAIGNERELTVSPQHRMLVSDWKVEILFAENQVLVAAKHMVNGTSIKQVEGGEVEYLHILFDRHEIIFADGCATESLHLGDESLKSLGEVTRQQLYKKFPALIDKAKNNKTYTARHCLKGFEAALLFNNINSLSHENATSKFALHNTEAIRPKLMVIGE